MKSSSRSFVFGLLLCMTPALLGAHPVNGNLYGTVVGNDGAPLPGVTVTLSGIGAPRTAVTDEQGNFRFLNLSPGTYQVKAQLGGFSIGNRPNLQVRESRNVELEIRLNPAVLERITVTEGSEPVLDTRRGEIELEKIPTARDPWAILQSTPSVLTDRINIGGNEAGQQAVFTGDPMEAFGKILAGDDLFEEKGGGSYSYTDPATGKEVTILYPEGWDEGLPPPDAPADALPPPQVPDGMTFENFFLATPRETSSGSGQAQDPNSVWSVDGVVITDMAAIGSSPAYYDFDAFEEMQVSTGGTDPMLATPGAVLNMVTRRGTNEWRGSGRYLITDEDARSAVDQAAAPAGGNRVTDVTDYGAELGGPIIKDRLWIWGSYGSQEVDLLNIDDVSDFEAINEISKLLTIDANGNDATSPDFDPNTIVQYSFQPICTIPGFNTYTFRGAEGQADCQEIEASLRNTFGTGAFRGYLVDPFADPPIRVESTAQTWADLEGPTEIYKLEDSHVFSSDFYLTGLYSYGGGGFQLVPQGGSRPTVRIGSDVLPSRYDAVAGWIPRETLRPFSWDISVEDRRRLGGPYGEPPARGTGIVPFTVFDREDFKLCPSGVWITGYDAGTSIDLGNGSSFTPYEPADVDCDEFEWETITPRVGLTYSLGQEGRTLAGANGLWFFGGRAFEEEEDGDPVPLSSSPFAMSMGNTNLTDPTVLNVTDLDSTLIQALAQWFAALMRFRAGTTSADAQVGPGGSIAFSTTPQASGALGTAMTEIEAVPSVLLVSLGTSTGEAFRAYVLGDGPPSIEGMAMLKPVDASPAVVAQLEQRMRSAGAALTTVEGFCFEFDKQVPQAGTAYVFASPSEQQRFEPLARVMEAGKRVLDAGGLTPDTQLDTYYPSITQWAIWTREKGFDMESFGEAWLGHVRKNAEQSGQPFTEELARIVQERVPGRWRDIQKILEEADGIARSR
jgi:hypothetical protein